MAQAVEEWYKQMLLSRCRHRDYRRLLFGGCPESELAESNVRFFFVCHCYGISLLVGGVVGPVMDIVDAADPSLAFNLNIVDGTCPFLSVEVAIVYEMGAN